MKLFSFVLLLMGLALAPALGQEYMPGELLVTFQPYAIGSLSKDSTGFTSCGIAYIDLINRASGMRKFSSSGYPGILETKEDYLVVFPESANISAIAAAYEADSRIKWAHPNYIGKVAFTPNDTLFRRLHFPQKDSSQWSMDSLHLKLEKAWDITQGNRGVKIAIIDEGTFWKHIDIENNLWINTLEDRNGNGRFDSLPYPQYPSNVADLDGIDQDGNGYVDDVIGYDFSRVGSDTLPDPVPLFALHGTATASLAAGVTHNIAGIASAGDSCRLMILSAAVGGGYNSGLVSTLTVKNALYYAARNGANVVNMSFTLTNDNPTLKTAIDYAFYWGCVLVAAAGNNHGNSIRYPASYAKVLGVTSTYLDDVRSHYADYSDSVDLAAPGSNRVARMDTTNLGNIRVWEFAAESIEVRVPCDTCSDSGSAAIGAGTSYSAPLVAGVAGLIKSAYPNFTNLQIMAKLKSSTDNIDTLPGNDSTKAWYRKLGTGRVNAYKALTFFDTIPKAQIETTLTGTVYASGPIIVPQGRRLILAAGAKLLYLPGDVVGRPGNPSPGKGKLIVYGELKTLGTKNDSVIIAGFGASPQAGAWGGIVFAHPAHGELNFTRISHADTAISVQGDTATVRVRSCSFGQFTTMAVYSKSSKVDLGKTTDGQTLGGDCGKNNVFMKTASAGAIAVKNVSGGTLFAEANWWDSTSPPAGWFVGSIDKDPFLSAPANQFTCVADPGAKVAIKDPLPRFFELGQNYPNPFNPTTTIKYSIPKAAKVELEIYNILGQTVKTLVEEEKPAGFYQVSWDGRDEHGRGVSTGIYLYQIRAGDFVETKKMQFVK